MHEREFRRALRPDFFTGARDSDAAQSQALQGMKVFSAARLPLPSGALVNPFYEACLCPSS